LPVGGVDPLQFLQEVAGQGPVVLRRMRGGVPGWDNRGEGFRHAGLARQGGDGGPLRDSSPSAPDDRIPEFPALSQVRGATTPPKTDPGREDTEMWDHLFKTVNDVGVKATYKKTAVGSVDMSRVGGAEWGVCAGMSAIWLQKMFAGRDILSAPDRSAAGILYAKWANAQDGRGLSAEQFNQGLLTNAGLEVESTQTFGPAAAVMRMGTVHGSYYVSTGNHAMAAVTGKSGFYFFDPNGGAWKTTAQGEFEGVKAHIETYAGSSGYTPQWVVIKVAPGG